MTVKEEVRQTGIDAVGNVPWGTHLCHFYESRQDLIDILVPYFKQGLSDNECCIWVASEPLNACDAKAALKGEVPDLDSYIREGRIEILDYREWYSRTEGVNTEIALQVWLEKLENALNNGCEGLRINGNTFWLEQKDRAKFTAYEEAVNRMIGKHPMLAICSYSLSKCSAMDIIDATGNHRGTLVKRDGRWQMVENSRRKDAEAERERLLAEVQTERDRISALVASLPDEVWFADTQKRFTMANPPACKEFGLGTKETVEVEKLAANLEVLRPDGSPRPIEEAPPLRALNGETVTNAEEIIRTPASGKLRHRVVSATPVRDKENRIIGSVSVVRDITERKALERRTEYLSRFPSENPNPVMRVTADGILQYANAAAAPVLSDWKTAVHGKVPRAWRKHITKAISAGTPAVRESTVGRDTYSFSIAPFPDKQYVNLYGTCITELKALHKREKLGIAARTALDTVEAMHEGIALIEMDGTVSSVNPALVKLTGYSRTRLQGHNLIELIPQLLTEKDAEYAMDAMRTALGGKVPFLNELTLISKKGIRIPIMTKVAFIKDDTGSPSIIVLNIQDISRIVKARKVVEESKQRLEEAQRIAHIGNWDWDILEGTLTWSDEVFRIFGFDPQEFIPDYETFLHAIHPDERQMVQGAVDKALYENLPYSMDHRIVRPDGLECVVHEQAEVYRNATGRPVRMVGTVQDITARKLAEDRNRITASFLRLFQDKTTEQAYLDAVNEVVRNWCGCRCTGIRVPEGKSCIPYKSSLGFDAGFLVSENRISMKDAPCTCARVISGNPATYEKPYMTPAGSFFCNDTGCFYEGLPADQKPIVRGLCIDSEFRSMAIIPITHQGRTLAAFHLADPMPGKLPQEKVAFIENIAPLIGEGIRRFQVEKTLISSERRYRTLIENLPAITYTTNMEGTITYVSPQIDRILGFSPEDYLQNHDICRNQLHPDDRDRVLEELAQTRSSVEPYTLEYRMIASDGHTVWLRNHGMVVCNDAGKPSYIQGVMYDITDEKKTQATVRSLATHLTLAEEEERKRLALALHDTINQTLALSKIKLGSLNRLMIGDKAKNALQEIRDLFSQAVEQTRSLSFELSPPILYELGLREAVDWLGEKFRKQYGFDFVLSGQIENREIAEHIKVLIFQSIRELLVNTGKHANAKHVHVTLDQKGDELTVIVHDDGKGFDIKTARMRAAQRNSIGLFSTEDRMEHLGGTFKVTSEPGNGTRIMLTVPLKCKSSETEDHQ